MCVSLHSLCLKDDMGANPDPSVLATPQINGKQTNKNGALYEEDITSCGLGKYTPKWLQKFASKKIYVLVYGILGMNQAAIGTYFIGTISTIEKRFKLPSSTFGFISSSWDIGVIFTVLIMGYLGTGHKTKWVAISSVIAALSCYLRYLPHILFGTSSDTDLTSNKSSFHLCKQSLSKHENCVLNSDGLIATIIFVIAHIALGIGTSTYNTLGAAYLDDNSMKDKAPFLISLASCFRLLGPTIGFLLASYALEVNKSRNSSATYSQNDQNYIGAWQWGWIPLGTLHLVLALMMGFFPRTLPREAQRRKVRNSVLGSSVRRKLSLKDLKCKLVRLLKNHLLMHNVLGSTFYMFGVIGHRIFLPKYLEAQFMQSASRATFITGTVGIICALVGIFISGYFISKFKPHPRILAAWSLLTKITEATVYVMFAFISCKKGDFFGVTQDRFSLVSSCNSMCDCSPGKYSPVCDMNTGTTFFSPCQAGCTNSSSINGTMLFGDCSCLHVDGFAQNGACSTNCEDNLFYFLILLCFMKFLSSTGKAGTTIIQYRSVDPDDKALSIALSEIMVSCLAFIPAPIIYGGILDKSCLLWEEECGTNGNCLLYDERKLRLNSNFTSSAFIFVAVVFDYLIYKSVKRLNIYDDKPEMNGASEKLNVMQEEIAIETE